MTSTIQIDPSLLSSPSPPGHVQFLPCTAGEDVQELPVDSRLAGGILS